MFIFKKFFLTKNFGKLEIQVIPQNPERRAFWVVKTVGFVKGKNHYFSD